VELITVEDAHLTYPPRFRRHQDGVDTEETSDDDGTGGYEGDDDKQGVDASGGGRGDELPTVALRGVSLTVHAGEGVALLGKPGSGRSTVLSLLSGVLRPDSGRVLVRGQATGLPAAGTGFLGHLPVAENIVRNLQLMGETTHRARELAPTVAEWAGLTPQLQTRTSTLGRPVVRQLGYATALHADPTVFLADDDLVTLPKAFRDKATERLMTFRDATHALVVVANRLELLTKLCTRGLLIDGGRVVSEGSVPEMVETFRQMRRDESEEAEPDEQPDG
jgi:ABC-2 type transport system ATP-binding protein